MNLSIITPSYKQLDWLRLCVASVRDQVAGAAAVSSISKLSVEHIIQDGGSPGIEDFALEVGADFYRDGILISHSKLRIPNYSLAIYSERDEGMYDAINQGFEKSSGEICAWLNSDEQYLENALPKVAEIFSKNPKLDVLLGDAILVNASVEPVCYRRIMVPGRWHTRLDHLHSLSCAMFFNKSTLPSPPLNPRWKVISDTILMDYWLGARKRIMAIGDPLSVYSFTGSNLSGNPDHGEHARWLGELGFPPLAIRPLVVLAHRIRRMLHGAYGQFAIDVGLYTRECITARISRVANVPGTWPENQ